MGNENWKLRNENYEIENLRIWNETNKHTNGKLRKKMWLEMQKKKVNAFGIANGNSHGKTKILTRMTAKE